MPSDLEKMFRESKERDKERDRERAAATCYGVFPHAIEGTETGRGYVVRPIDCQSGSPHDQRNYGGVRMVARYKREAAASAYVDKHYP